MQTFERDPSSGSQVRVHTNIKKKAKTDAAKINTFRKTPFSFGNKTCQHVTWALVNQLIAIIEVIRACILKLPLYVPIH